MGFPSGSVVKNSCAMQDTWVQSLGREDPLEKEMATHSSIFGWEIPRTEEPGRLQSMWLQTVWHNLATKQQQDHHDTILMIFLLTNLESNYRL